MYLTESVIRLAVLLRLIQLLVSDGFKTRNYLFCRRPFLSLGLLRLLRRLSAALDRNNAILPVLERLGHDAADLEEFGRFELLDDDL